MRRWGILLALLTSVVLAGATSAQAAGSWAWPGIGPVTRPFQPPAGPYGPGHRGIDIGVPEGTLIRAPAPGRVSFAGAVAGSLFLTIDHGNGLLSTYSWLSGLLAQKGDVVGTGQPIALTGWGHPGDPSPSLHFGVRLGGTYVDPMLYLGPINLADLIRLAPLPPGFP